MSVTNPGPLPDADLDTPAAMPGLLVGISADLSVAVVDQAYFGGLLADELAHSGNYNNERYFYQGAIRAEHTNTVWANMQVARWVAEDGIERMRRVLGDGFASSSLVPRAYALAGFANRLAGENVCHAVINAGPKQDHTMHFQRALEQFTEAIARAESQGDAKVVMAARAGRASIRAWLGDWAGAVADAELVPADFRYDAVFSNNTSRENNNIVYETVSRREVTVHATPWAEIFGDPRVPWDTVRTGQGAVQTGQDGQTPFFRQGKYKALGDNIALVKGTEMLLLRAEAALRDGDVGTATTLMTDARAVHGLPAVTAADETEAWTLLRQERGAELWLEARRIWDLRRWFDEGRIGPWKEAGQVMCVMPSRNEEASNPNL
jgi:hypothetical protein